MDHSNVLPIADPSRPLSQEDSRETFYPSQAGQSKSNKMPASKSQAPDSKPTAFPGQANLALESEAWLSGSVNPKGPPCPLVPNVAFGSVAQPVAKALTGTAAPPAAALPPPPVQQQHCHHHRQHGTPPALMLVIGGMRHARKMNIEADGSLQSRRTCCITSDGWIGPTWSKTNDCIKVSMP